MKRKPHVWVIEGRAADGWYAHLDVHAFNSKKEATKVIRSWDLWRPRNFRIVKYVRSK